MISHPGAVQTAVEKFQAQAVDPDDIISVNCDIYAPCALGAILNDETIPKLKAKVIAGSANNQLKEARHGDRLHELGIVYAPDYVINAGGVINVADELQGYNVERAMSRAGEFITALPGFLKYPGKRGFQLMLRQTVWLSRGSHSLEIPAVRFCRTDIMP